MANSLDAISLQLLVAYLRGLAEVRLSGADVVDANEVAVLPDWNKLRHLPTRAQVLARSMGFGERDVYAQARKLTKSGCLKLRAMTARTSRSKGADSSDAVRTWQTHAISSLEAAPASTVNGSWETGIGKLINRIATDVLSGGRIAMLDPLPGLEPRDVTSVWVDADITRLRTRDEAFTSPQIGFEMEDGERRQRASLFLDGFSGCAGLFGSPGAGKSTFLKWVATGVAHSRFEGLMLPLLVPLRRYAQERSKRTLSLFQYAFEWHGVHDDAANLGNSLLDYCIARDQRGFINGRKVLFLLDGWDEVPSSLRQIVLDEIEQVTAACSCLLTSRPSALHSLPIIQLARLEPLAPGAMWSLIHSWLSEAESRQLIGHLTRHPRLEMFSKNAFVLTALCGATSSRSMNIHETLPRSVSELYRAVLRAIQRHLSESHFTAMDDEHLRVCERLAYHALAEASNAPAYEFGAEDLHCCGGDPEMLSSVLAPSRLVVRADPNTLRYSFLHPTMHEYLAARYLSKDRNTDALDSLVRCKLHSPLWSEVIKYLSAEALRNSNVSSRLANTLEALLDSRDDYGVMVVRVADVIAEVGVDDGGELLIGKDLRPLLWELVRRWPQYQAAAATLSRLDVAYLSNRWEECIAASKKYLAIREQLVGPEAEREKIEHRKRLHVTGTANAALRSWVTPAEEPTSLHRTPRNWYSGPIVTRLHEVQRILRGEHLADEPESHRDDEVHAARLGIRARCGDQQAITDLRDTYWRSSSPGARGSALRQLGETPHVEARDVLLGIVAASYGIVQDGLLALDSLLDFPCGNGDVLLAGFLEDSQMAETLRCQAAFALDSSQDADVIAKVSSVAFSENSSVDLRKACIGVLGSAGQVAHLSKLTRLVCDQELPQADTFAMDAAYQIMHRCSSRLAFPDAFEELEKLTEYVLSRDDDHYRGFGVRYIQFFGLDRLKRILDQTVAENPSDAIVRGLEATAARMGHIRAARAYLNFKQRVDAQPGIREPLPLSPEAVLAFLQIDPSLLREIDRAEYDATIAKWSQQTGTLVFGDDIVRPNEENPKVANGHGTDAVLEEFSSRSISIRSDSELRGLEEAAREAALREGIAAIKRFSEQTNWEFDWNRFRSQEDVGQLTEVFIYKHMMEHCKDLERFFEATPDRLTRSMQRSWESLFSKTNLHEMLVKRLGEEGPSSGTVAKSQMFKFLQLRKPRIAAKAGPRNDLSDATLDDVLERESTREQLRAEIEQYSHDHPDKAVLLSSLLERLQSDHDLDRVRKIYEELKSDIN